MINGDFQKVLNKFEIENKLKALKLSINIGHCGVVISVLHDKLPVELEIVPKMIEAKACYCEAIKERGNKTILNIAQTIEFVKKSVEELNK
jgi:hypothetical protein